MEVVVTSERIKQQFLFTAKKKVPTGETKLVLVFFEVLVLNMKISSDIKIRF